MKKFPYAQVRRLGHPLADKRGRVRLHRLVLWDRLGPGAHPCHWCGQELHWRPTPDQVALVGDHVDANPTNNAAENIVAACQPCNATRANRARTTCSRGHSLTPESTYVHPSTGWRSCRICKAERSLRRYYRLRADGGCGCPDSMPCEQCVTGFGRGSDRAPGDLLPCGTHAAWLRHRKAEEDPCSPCSEAHKHYVRWKNERRKARHVLLGDDGSVTPITAEQDADGAA